MSDLISRQAVIEVVHRTIFDFFDIVEDDSESPITEIDKRLLEVNKTITATIRKLPTIDPERHGNWITYCIATNPPKDIFCCSACGEAVVNKKTKYCPHCGARMDL